MGEHSLSVSQSSTLLSFKGVLQIANGLQTPVQAAWRMSKQAVFDASQKLLDHQLAYQQPVDQMSEQQLDAALTLTRWEKGLQVSPHLADPVHTRDEQGCLGRDLARS